MTVIANITTAATITVTKKSQNPQKEEQNKNIVRKELDEKRKQGMKFWWIPLHSAKKKNQRKKFQTFLNVKMPNKRRQNGRMTLPSFPQCFCILAVRLRK